MISAAASALPEAQQRLDEDFIYRAVRFLSDVRHLDADRADPEPAGSRAGVGGALADPLVRAVVPQPFVLRAQSVTLTMELTDERDRETSVGVRIGGRLVAAFYAHRYRTSTTRMSRVTVVAENVPTAAPPPALPPPTSPS